VMDIGQLIVDRVKPVLLTGGYAYEGPLVAEKWTRTQDGFFLVLLKLGNGDRYMHLRCPTLYHPQVKEYFHSRQAAEKAYEEATREPYREPTPVHEQFASSDAKERYQREMAAIVEEGRRWRQ
jgi:hypothetical protein